MKNTYFVQSYRTDSVESFSTRVPCEVTCHGEVIPLASADLGTILKNEEDWEGLEVTDQYVESQSGVTNVADFRYWGALTFADALRQIEDLGAWAEGRLFWGGYEGATSPYNVLERLSKYDLAGAHQVLLTHGFTEEGRSESERLWREQEQREREALRNASPEELGLPF